MNTCTECLYSSYKDAMADLYCQKIHSGIFLTDVCNNFELKKEGMYVKKFTKQDTYLWLLENSLDVDWMTDKDYEFIMAMLDDMDYCLVQDDKQRIRLYSNCKNKMIECEEDLFSIIDKCIERAIDTYEMVNESGFCGTQEEYDEIIDAYEYAISIKQAIDPETAMA